MQSSAISSIQSATTQLVLICDKYLNNLLHYYMAVVVPTTLTHGCSSHGSTGRVGPYKPMVDKLKLQLCQINEEICNYKHCRSIDKTGPSGPSGAQGARGPGANGATGATGPPNEDLNIISWEYTTPGTYNVIPPASTSFIKAYLVGAGGGGGGASSTVHLPIQQVFVSVGGGGGGGGNPISFDFLPPAGGFTLEVGSGGIGGTPGVFSGTTGVNGTSGTDGGSTSVSLYGFPVAVASGGYGGGGGSILNLTPFPNYSMIGGTGGVGYNGGGGGSAADLLSLGIGYISSIQGAGGQSNAVAAGVAGLIGTTFYAGDGGDPYFGGAGGVSTLLQGNTTYGNGGGGGGSGGGFFGGFTGGGNGGSALGPLDYNGLTGGTCCGGGGGAGSISSSTGGYGGAGGNGYALFEFFGT